MSKFRAIIFAVLTLAAAAAIVPAAVFAAPVHHKLPPAHSEVYGSLVSFDANGAIIQTKSARVKVRFAPVVAYVSYDQAAAVLGLKAGEQVDATGIFLDGTLHVSRLRYDTMAFPVRNEIRFDGRYVASSSTTSNTITIRLKGDKDIIFNTDANTRYYQNGHRLAAPPTYKVNEHIIVRAQQFSDQSWLAKTVNVIEPKAKAH